MLLAACASPTPETAPQTAYLNATIWTGDPDQPRAEALLIAGDSIVAVGSNESIQARLQPDDTTYDAGGAMIVPGFIDSHVHFITGGFRLASNKPVTLSYCLCQATASAHRVILTPAACNLFRHSAP